MKGNVGKIFIGVAVIAVAASIVFAQYVSKSANEGIVIEPHVTGNPDAAVTLTEYSDFQCPACGQFEPYIEAVLDQYGDQIRFEYKHFPLLSIHPYALPAARAAEAAAQQGTFWEMHNKLFAEQSVWANSSNPQSYFIAYADELGLDVSQFKTQMKASVITDAIKASYDEAVALGLTGTPSFFLNGERFEFTTIDDFTKGIEAALGVGTSTDATTTTTTDASAGVQFSL